MDLIPAPDQVVSAARNVAHKILSGHVADLRPMPRTLVDEGMLREVYHYRPPQGVRESGDPVLLVSPLAAPALCFDLRRGCSVAEHLVRSGRRTYLVEYGEVSFANRTLGMEHWVDEVVPAAVRAVSEHAGGRPVHLVGWSLGGIFSLLVAADRTDLPIASSTVLAAPVDVTKVPLVAPVAPLVDLTAGDGPVARLNRLLGGVPAPLVRRACRLSGIDRLVGKPIAVAARLDDADFLAQVEAVDRFTASMTAYPGRTFGQIYHRLLKGNQLATGTVRMGRREIALADLRVPLLVLAGGDDGIAPVAAVEPVLDLVPQAASARLEVVPGGHLGMLTGRAARTTTWRILDEFLDERAAASAVPPSRKKPGRKASRKGGSASPSPTTKATARGTRPEPDAIGANPARRYGSASSRSLAARP